jgi:hypothetical protein
MNKKTYDELTHQDNKDELGHDENEMIEPYEQKIPDGSTGQTDSGNRREEEK